MIVEKKGTKVSPQVEIVKGIIRIKGNSNKSKNWFSTTTSAFFKYGSIDTGLFPLSPFAVLLEQQSQVAKRLLSPLQSSYPVGKTGKTSGKRERTLFLFVKKGLLLCLALFQILGCRRRHAALSILCPSLERTSLRPIHHGALRYFWNSMAWYATNLFMLFSTNSACSSTKGPRF